MLRATRVLLTALMVLAMTDVSAVAAQLPATATAFIHVTVVPMDRERVLEDSTVLVVDGTIRELGPTSSVAIPPGATVIDGSGKYLLPGLADMHAHSWEEEDFPLLLANGVTTIRNMFGGPTHLRWKERIAAGEFTGPTVYTAGPIIDGNPPIWPGPVVENAAQARETVSAQRAAGYDFLKVYARLSREAFDAVVNESRASGMSVAGHVPDAVGLSAALRSGIRSIEHLSGYEMLARKEIGPGEEASWARLDESRFASTARETAASGTWNCPTLVLFQHRIAPGESAYLQKLLARPEMRYVAPETIRSWHPENNYLKNSTPARASSSRDKGDIMRKKLVKSLHDAGARLLLGTDYGNPFVVPGFSLQHELRNFVDAGLSPFQAIRAGTSGAAEFMNAASEWGTVAVGRRADLILLEANPLEDVSTISKPAGVMMRGKWHSQAEMASELEKLAQRFAPADTRQHRIIPVQPLTQDFEVIHGDPDKAGEPFVMRIRELPGTIIPPHKHPVDEHITVVQGTLYFAVGEKFDRAAMQEIKTGGYAFIPKGKTMFGYIPDGAIVQVHGIGPFHIHWRAGDEWRTKDQTLDDPGSTSVFNFKKGDRVVGSRGKGRITQGYFSGEILQYEVTGDDGALFMATEDELRRL